MGQSSIVIHKGRKEEKYEIYIEDYVMSFLKEETGTLELSEVFFYGFREKGGKRFIVYGAGRNKDLEVFDKYDLLDEIGCRLTQAGPVFLVHEKDDIYEIKGYKVFYQDNHEMQSYLIDRKTECIDRGQPRPPKYTAQPRPERYDTPGHKNPYAAVSLQLCIVFVVLVAIVINSTNSYDKMQQLNQSAEEVFFAMENQEADISDEAGRGQDEIVVKRESDEETSSNADMSGADGTEITVGDATGEEGVETSGGNMAGEDAVETADGNVDGKSKAETGENTGGDGNKSDESLKDHVADSGREEDILKLVTLENEERSAKQKEADTGIEAGEQEKAAGDEPTDTDKEQNKSDKDDEPEEEADQVSGESEEGVEALSRNVTRYYKVERGDTLYTISKKIYGDISYVHKICELNNISDPDNIRYGQKIILP